MKIVDSSVVIDLLVSDKPDLLQDDRPYLKPSLLRMSLVRSGEEQMISGFSLVVIFGRLYKKDGSLGAREGSCAFSLPLSNNPVDVPAWIPDAVSFVIKNHLSVVDRSLEDEIF